MAWKRHKQYRLYGFDYSQNGAYFITIVVRNRRPLFGEIIDKEMRLSAIGEFVTSNIADSSGCKHGTRIVEYQVMPDHVHLIITISGKPENAVPQYAKSIQPLIPGSVSSFINHFKGRVTRWCREQGIDGFAWQGRFHDRIIRNEKEYMAIKRYVQNNVRDWNDKKNKRFGG